MERRLTKLWQISQYTIILVLNVDMAVLRLTIPTLFVNVVDMKTSLLKDQMNFEMI
nr:MAG TPA: hypothetical protein [Caudoviricetes sp.]